MMMKASPTVLIPAVLFLLAIGLATRLWAADAPAPLPTAAQVQAQQQRQANAAMPDAQQMGEAAAQASGLLASPELQAGKVAGFAPTLKAVPAPVAPPPAGVLDKLFAQVGKPLFPTLKPDGELMVLVSSSMPDEALRNLAQQADKAGAVLVLRGLVGDSLPQTTAKIRQVLGDQGGDSTFQINPEVFRAYNVQSVPTFVLARQPAGAADGSTCEVGTDYVAVRGDVNLQYALQKLAGNKGWETVANRYLAAMGVKP
jgi:conjugal transfer pilus assembly protein TrbC